MLFTWPDTFFTPEKLKVLAEGDPTEKISLAGVGVVALTPPILLPNQSKAKAGLDCGCFLTGDLVAGPGPWLGLLLVFTPENLNPGDDRDPTLS